MAQNQLTRIRIQLAAGTLFVVLVVIFLIYPNVSVMRLPGHTATAWDRALSAINDSAASAPAALRHTCGIMAARSAGVGPDVRHVMRWVCEQVGAPIPPKLDADGCNKVVTYNPIGRLGNLLNIYAIIYSYTRMYGAKSYVDTGMWKTIHQYFPHISLPPTSDLGENVQWTNIQYQQVEQYLACRPGEVSRAAEFYYIENYPDRNGIDVFHPFYTELRSEFQFSDSLQREAQEFLHSISLNRTSTTFVGFHIRRTDYKNYINTKYNTDLPDEAYFAKALEYYRSRYSDALFIVCSDDMEFVERSLREPQHRRGLDDIVIAGDRNTVDPGRDIAVLASCNHSIVTVGTYGFWGAYLAGGTVLVPERQTHLQMGDRHAPLLEIQIAGAKNWIAIR